MRETRLEDPGRLVRKVPLESKEGDDERLKQDREWRVKSEKLFRGKMCRISVIGWGWEIASGRWFVRVSQMTCRIVTRFCGLC